jgi:hypothetical protein
LAVNERALIAMTLGQHVSHMAKLARVFLVDEDDVHQYLVPAAWYLLRHAERSITELTRALSTTP